MPTETNYDYFERMYGGRLGNDQPGDGYRYRGRGFIQITGKSNYRSMGLKVAELWGTSPDLPDFDFVTNPDAVTDPDISAAILAIYFRDTRALPTASWPHGYSLIDAANAEDTEWLRKLVQGGTAGLEGYRRMFALLGGAAPIVPAPIAFNREYPAIRQDDEWSCWPTSARWLLGAIGADADGDGQPPTEAYVEGQAIRDGIVSMRDGLLIATAGPAARWLNEQWLTALGLTATAHPGLGYDDAIRLALEGGLLVGGNAWNHWSAVRGVSTAGELMLMNPSPSHRGVGEVLGRDEWRAWGPWNAIAVPIGEQEDTTMIAELQHQLAQRTAERDELKAQRDTLIVNFAEAVDAEGDRIAAALEKQRQYRLEAIGPRPS